MTHLGHQRSLCGAPGGQLIEPSDVAIASSEAMRVCRSCARRAYARWAISLSAYELICRGQPPRQPTLGLFPEARLSFEDLP